MREKSDVEAGMMAARKSQEQIKAAGSYPVLLHEALVPMFKKATDHDKVQEMTGMNAEEMWTPLWG